MTHRTRVQLGTVVLLVALTPLAGCSDDDDSTASSSPATAPSESPATSTPPDASSATDQSTTAPPTTTPSTTALPTTTTDSTAATKAAVADAVAQARQSYNYAIANYDAPDALEVLARTTVPDSPSWNLTLQNMATLRSNGWLARPNPDIPDTSTVEGEVQLLDGPPATKAQATVCTISAGVLYKPGAAPDGSDVIINDEVVARREQVTMVLQDGAWKIEQGTNLGTWNGSSECPAAG